MRKISSFFLTAENVYFDDFLCIWSEYTWTSHYYTETPIGNYELSKRKKKDVFIMFLQTKVNRVII